MGHATEDAFLASIAANPDDNLVKLVYADWLEEQGDELAAQKARFIRKQTEYLAAEKRSSEASAASDELRNLAYTLPHDWCPKVVHASLPRYTLPDPMRSPGARRVIKTARTTDEINEAARNGLWPVVLPVERNNRITSWVAVYQNPETGEIQTSGDMRWAPAGTRVVNVRYYPHHFRNPFAAYLVPKDLPPGEEVWLEDVIEDVVGIWGNQGHTYRLESAPARWDGTRFEILFDSERDAERWIG